MKAVRASELGRMLDEEEALRAAERRAFVLVVRASQQFLSRSPSRVEEHLSGCSGDSRRKRAERHLRTSGRSK